jgi:pyridoxal phosphate enzyme (YggS family)
MSVADNLKSVQERIAAAAGRAGRDPSSIKLIVVTKTVTIEKIREAVTAGAVILGENRVQEARDKIEMIGRGAAWHLIGHLQTNKARYAVKLFDLIHSVDGLDVAIELDRQAAKIGKVQDVLMEVSIAGEAQKTGVGLDRTADLITAAAKLKNVAIKGLMTIPPYSDDPEDSRPHYRKMSELLERAARERIPGAFLQELSMGMSNDFEVAIEEGATMVRVGTAIFGERK